MTAGRYAVRRTRSSERGRWVICTSGIPNHVLASGYLTLWGAKRSAKRWSKQNKRAEKLYRV